MRPHFNVMTPAYIIDETALCHNLQLLQKVEQRSGARILLATKAFSMYHVFPMMKDYISGVTSSGLYEAILGRQEMNKEVHTYAPAFREADIAKILEISDHVIFNSPSQWMTYRQQALTKVSCGLRINPQFSKISIPLYDPCAPNSRMGITLETLQQMDLTGIEGFHIHAMCEQGADTLKSIVEVVERDFAPYLHQLTWLNLGGGHHITKPGYDMELLISIIQHLQQTYHVQVYLEPGEAVAYQAGWLVGSVLDIVHNGMDIAILDTSAACHMPDVLEMPYRPMVVNSAFPDTKTYTYRFAGNTCLAGDIIGDYAFDEELHIHDQVVFEDMAIYTMVKNNTFNGMPLPAIYIRHSDGSIALIKQFGYTDFKQRL